MGIPAIVGCGDATEVLETGQPVTVSCAEGEEGKVYAGLVPFEIQETQLDNLPPHAHENPDECGQPGRGLWPGVHPLRRGGAGSPGVHHRQPHQGPPPWL